MRVASCSAAKQLTSAESLLHTVPSNMHTWERYSTGNNCELQCWLEAVNAHYLVKFYMLIAADI